MRAFNSGRVHDKLVNRLERQEKQRRARKDRFIRFKLEEIHNRLTQALLMDKVVETNNPAAVSKALLTALEEAVTCSDHQFKYFISPIRDLVPTPNPYSLYVTQYILEKLVSDESVVDVYWTDVEIYKLINGIMMDVFVKFEKTEDEVKRQIENNKRLVPGSREYEIALDQLLRKKVGEPYKFQRERAERLSRSSM